MGVTRLCGPFVVKGEDMKRRKGKKRTPKTPAICYQHFARRWQERIGTPVPAMGEIEYHIQNPSPEMKAEYQWKETANRTHWDYEYEPGKKARVVYNKTIGSVVTVLPLEQDK